MPQYDSFPLVFYQHDWKKKIYNHIRGLRSVSEDDLIAWGVDEQFEVCGVLWCISEQVRYFVQTFLEFHEIEDGVECVVRMITREGDSNGSLMRFGKNGDTYYASLKDRRFEWN